MAVGLLAESFSGAVATLADVRGGFLGHRSVLLGGCCSQRLDIRDGAVIPGAALVCQSIHPPSMGLWMVG